MLVSELPREPDVRYMGGDATQLDLDRAFDTERVVLLHGMAGSGKTATPAEFSRLYAHTGGVAGPVLFTSFKQPRPLARVLDGIGQVFGSYFEQEGIQWLALDDALRRSAAIHVLRQVPVLWIWNNVEPVGGYPDGVTQPLPGHRRLRG